jgi:hypothetical protein
LGLYHKYGRAPFLEYFNNLKAQNDSPLTKTLLERFAELAPKINDRKHLISWFEDQVNHPVESQHTLEEIMHCLEGKFILRSTSINYFAKITSLEALFDLEKKQNKVGLQHLLRDNFYPGFFNVWLQKIECD